MIEFIGNVSLVFLTLVAVSLCVFMPILVFVAIKDLKNRGAK